VFWCRTAIIQPGDGELRGVSSGYRGYVDSPTDGGQGVEPWPVTLQSGPGAGHALGPDGDPPDRTGPRRGHWGSRTVRLCGGSPGSQRGVSSVEAHPPGPVVRRQSVARSQLHLCYRDLHYVVRQPRRQVVERDGLGLTGSAESHDLHLCSGHRRRYFSRSCRVLHSRDSARASDTRKVLC